MQSKGNWKMIGTRGRERKQVGSHELGLCVVDAVLGLSLQRLGPENEPLTCKKKRPQMGLKRIRNGPKLGPKKIKTTIK